MFIPNELKALAVFLLTQGLLSLARLIGFDLKGSQKAIAAVIVAGLVVALDGLIALLPKEQQDAVKLGLLFAVSLLGAFGFHDTLAEYATK